MRLVGCIEDNVISLFCVQLHYNEAPGALLLLLLPVNHFYCRALQMTSFSGEIINQIQVKLTSLSLPSWINRKKKRRNKNKSAHLSPYCSYLICHFSNFWLFSPKEQALHCVCVSLLSTRHCAAISSCITDLWILTACFIIAFLWSQWLLMDPVPSKSLILLLIGLDFSLLLLSAYRSLWLRVGLYPITYMLLWA